MTSELDDARDERAGNARFWSDRSRGYGNLDWVRRRDFIDFFIRACDPGHADTALDVGVGPGAIAQALAPSVRRVLGLDLSREMLRPPSHPVPNLTLHQGDVHQLPFADGAFSLVTARMVFHHVERIEAGLAEIFRVLRPGGRFVLGEGVPPDHRVHDRYVEIFRLKEKRHTFYETDLINHFDAAGFREIALLPHFMRRVSLNNWIDNAGLPEETVREIKRLHLEAEPYFWKAYRMESRDGDLFMDWKFAVLRGVRP